METIHETGHLHIKIERSRALEAFRIYTSNYDSDNSGVDLKIAHTYRVAKISERISESISEADVNLSWLLGLLHDIGRFEQITRYGTFKDALSVDHAELGADILFHDNLFDMFIQKENIDGSIKAMIETVIRLHNKLKIPEDLEPETEMYTKILRDADKIDQKI